MVTSPLDEIIDATFEIGRCMRATMLDLNKEKGMPNLLQIHALLLIERKPGITMKDLAQHLKVSGPSATVFVQRLVKLKLIQRLRDRKNRKLIHLSLTTIGKCVLTTMDSRRRAVEQKMFSVLSPSDQKQLARMLRKVLTGLPTFSHS